MTNPPERRHSFDRLFLTHLGARLREKYDPLVKEPLPMPHQRLVRSFAFSKAGLKLDRFNIRERVRLMHEKQMTDEAGPG